MKVRIKPLISFLGMAVLSMNTISYAETAPTTQDKKMGALIAKINQQISTQEQTIAELKAEVNHLKYAQKAATATATATSQAVKKKSATKNTSSADIAINAKDSNQPEARSVGYGAPVITAAYLGISPRWDASDLIVNQSNHNEDTILMQRDYQMDQAALKLGFGVPNSPVLEVSGKVEAQTYQAKPMSGSAQSNIDVSGADVYFVAHVSKWVNGLMDISYDNSAPNSTASTTNAELTTNSRVYVNQAFITFGNLSLSHLYSTVGLRAVPYGYYSTYMISNPYTENLFRIKNPSLSFGYQPMIGKFGPYAVGFLFKGDTGVGSTPQKINNFGGDLGYSFATQNMTANIGISGVANIADAEGMQANGISANGQFQGFGYAPTGAASPAEVIAHRVPGINTHMEFDIKQLTLLAEANTATKEFAPQDMSYNQHGAKPAAAHLEGIYSFNISQYPSFFALGYDESWQALALGSPKTRYISTIGTSLFKDTIEDFEFKHEINYAAGNTASGQNLAVVIPGHSSNTATLQVGYYF